MITFQRIVRSLALVAVLHATAFCQSLPVVATWYGAKSAAVSLTFDDNHPLQLKYAVPELNKRHLDATFFIVTGMGYWGTQDGWATMDWRLGKSMADSGHELAGHSVTHDQYSIAEVKQCIDTLKHYIPGKKWWTWAYPAGITDVKDEVKKYAIAARGADVSKVGDSLPADMYNIPTIVDLGTTANLTTAIAKRGWLIELIHCISAISAPNECTLGPNILVIALTDHLDTLVNRSAQLWVAPFGDVARYVRERQQAKIAQISSDATTRVYSLTDTLIDSVYNYPLTLKMTAPAGWTSCTVSQGGRTSAAILRSDTLIFNAVPDAGQITLTKGGTTSVLRGLTGMPNLTLRESRFGEAEIRLPTRVGRLCVEFYSSAGQRLGVIERRNVGPGTVALPLPVRRADARMVVARVTMDGVVAETVCWLARL